LRSGQRNCAIWPIGGPIWKHGSLSFKARSPIFNVLSTRRLRATLDQRRPISPLVHLPPPRESSTGNPATAQRYIPGIRRR
jgi:hypothetical protein